MSRFESASALAWHAWTMYLDLLISGCMLPQKSPTRTQAGEVCSRSARRAESAVSTRESRRATVSLGTG